MIIHVIRQGDTIYSISKKYDVPMEKIITDNSIENTERLMIGQAIVVMTDNVSKKVTPGNSLYSIARSYNVNVEDILNSNPMISNLSRIQAGQIINIPFKRQKMGTIYVNGYAFPNIEETVLQETLPNLTYISIFSYQIKEDGSLIPIDDGQIINNAREKLVAPMMVVTNIKEGGSFDSDLAHTILNNDEIQNKIIENSIEILKKGYYGLDIDIEYIYAKDREKYNNFLKKAVERLHPLGYTVTTALAPKISGDQKGLLYEAHDYPVHGLHADHIIIMTYEWGYTYAH